jgi:protein tyrosine phosphatase (PTP) superfamily phosphohydrolase (DUF442 family)
MNIPKYFQYNEHQASGAQPSSEQFSTLKEKGFEAVVNLSPSSARNALREEAALVEQSGMDYIHFPVDCSNLRPLHFNLFKEIMQGLEGKKVFVHCGGNVKSSNLLHMYHVLERGRDERESLETLKKIQNPEDKWIGYFQRMGMQGIEN